MVSRFFIWVCFYAAIMGAAYGQNDSQGRNILYRKEFGIGGELHTLGLGLGVSISRNMSVVNKRLWEIEFLNMKHPKEIRQPNTFPQQIQGTPTAPGSYVYGKQNNFLILRTGIGRMHVGFEKAENNGVQVRYFYTGGFSLGVLKPYYLDLVYQEDNTSVSYIRSEKYDPDVPIEENKFLQLYWIYGSSGFAKGLDQIRFIPGIYLKTGLNFEWGIYEDRVKAVETGFALDIFPKRVPIMILEANKQFFTTFYVKVIIGKRWD